MSSPLMYPRGKYVFHIPIPFKDTGYYLKAILFSTYYSKTEKDDHIKAIDSLEIADGEPSELIIELYRERFDESRQRAKDLTNKAASLFSGNAIVISIICSFIFVLDNSQLTISEIALLSACILCLGLSITASFKALRNKTYQTSSIDFGILKNKPALDKKRFFKMLILCTSHSDENGDRIADYVNATQYFLILALLFSTFFVATRYFIVTTNHNSITNNQNIELTKLNHEMAKEKQNIATQLVIITNKIDHITRLAEKPKELNLPNNLPTATPAPGNTSP